MLQSRRPRKRHLFFTMDDISNAVPPLENHAHSDYSDGSSPLLTMVMTAVNRGIHQLIMTEHTEPDLTPGPGWFGRYMREGETIRKSLQKSDLQLIMGLEVPITDFSGGLLWDTEMQEQAEFVLGAVHAYPGYGMDKSHLSPEEAIDLEYRGLLALLDNPHIDAIAHPGGFCQRYTAPFPRELFEKVVTIAVEREIAVELNPAYLSPMAPYVDICRQHNVMISPGSNAHSPEDIGRVHQVLSDICLTPR